MKTSRYSDSQILAILKQAEAGMPVPALCCKHGMSSATFYKWRAKFGGMDASMMKRMKELEKWAAKHDIQVEFIQPGNPQQNAYVERYNRTVRYSWLRQYLFDSIGEVQDYATWWLWFYNNERPNKANGGLPPKQMLIAA